MAATALRIPREGQMCMHHELQIGRDWRGVREPRVRPPRPYEVRYAALRAPLERIARTHPEYGYRRTATELREGLGIRVKHKVGRRLHRLWGLPLLRRTRLPRPSAVRQVTRRAGARANLVAPLETFDPLAVLYTDFTALGYAAGKAWLMALVDHTSKVVPGCAAGAQANTALALAAGRRARRWLRRHGVQSCPRNGAHLPPIVRLRA